MNEEMKGKVSALLEAVVAADDVIRPEERDFVRRAATRWKLPEPDAPLSLRRNQGAPAPRTSRFWPRPSAPGVGFVIRRHDLDPVLVEQIEDVGVQRAQRDGVQSTRPSPPRAPRPRTTARSAA